MDNFFKTFHLSWANFVGYLPALSGGIICFIVTIILANFLSKIAIKTTLKRSKDPLMSIRTIKALHEKLKLPYEVLLA